MATSQLAVGENVSTMVSSYQEQIEVLERRLEHGLRVIEQAHLAGDDVQDLEHHWMRLLSEYEQLYDLSH
jgi:hypothetical protein